MSRTDDHLIDQLNRDRDALTGPGFELPLQHSVVSITEEELLALEEQGARMIAAGKLVRQHLTQCDNGDTKTLAGFDDLLKYIGIYPEVSGDYPVGEQPRDY